MQGTRRRYSTTSTAALAAAAWTLAACAGGDTAKDGDTAGMGMRADTSAPAAAAAAADTAGTGGSPGAGAQRSDSALFGAPWTLVELDGKPPAPGNGGRAPTLELTRDGNRATGFSGCNRMTGSFQLAGDSLTFSRMAMTRMACPQGMDVERDYAAALEATRRYRIERDTLQLLGERGVRARLVTR